MPKIRGHAENAARSSIATLNGNERSRDTLMYVLGVQRRWEAIQLQKYEAL